MNVVAKALTNYVIRKGMIKQEERILYEYGFLTALEKGSCLLISLLITAPLHMVIEGVLFYIIFIPLRSYAGGLHLEHFWTCFILSCSTFSVVILIVKYGEVSIYISLLFFIILATLIWNMNMVGNINRLIDKEEEIYFKKQLKKFVIIDAVIVVLCTVFKKEAYVLLISITFLIVTFTMAIGKYKNSRPISAS